MPYKLILLVDNNENEAMLIRQALRENDIAADVVIARDGAEALDILFPAEGTAGIQPSVVFLDLNLPKVDGLEVLRRIRSHDSMLPVVVLSSTAHEEDVRDAYLLGANSYIRKDVDFDEFSESVKRIAVYWLNLKRAAADQFRLAIEASPTGMIMVDQRGKIVLVNAQVEKLFGYDRAELMGQSIDMLVPERFRGHHPKFRASFSSAPKARPMGAGRDLYGLRKDGSEMPIEIGLNPLETPEGKFVLSSVVDITERKHAEAEREDLLGKLQAFNAQLEERVRERTAELSDTLKEREVLLQEVHHRVKNNLQVIFCLINLQLRRIHDQPSRQALQECQTRVQAIALIHEMLYQSKDYSRIPFSAYARSLAGNVFQAAGATSGAIGMELAIDDISLGVGEAIPCGLILNELIINALKHAFPNGRRGIVRIEFHRVESGRLLLSVKDNGVGLPPDINLKKSHSLGMHLVYTLAEQLGMEMTIVRGDGTAFQFSFAINEEAPAALPAA